MRSTTLSILAALLAATSAAAQTADLRLAPDALRPARSTAALTAGGLVGGAVGLVAGFYAGALLAADEDEDDLDFLSGGVAGAAIGEGLLLPLGVHLANDRSGSYETSALVSLGLAAAGLLVLEAVHYDPPGAPIVLVAVPLAQLGAAIAIERRTD